MDTDVVPENFALAPGVYAPGPGPSFGGFDFHRPLMVILGALLTVESTVSFVARGSDPDILCLYPVGVASLTATAFKYE